MENLLAEIDDEKPRQKKSPSSPPKGGGSAQTVDKAAFWFAPKAALSNGGAQNREICDNETLIVCRMLLVPNRYCNTGSLMDVTGSSLVGRYFINFLFKRFGFTGGLECVQPGFAVFPDAANFAFRLAGGTDGPAVQNQPMAEVGRFFPAAGER